MSNPPLLSIVIPCYNEAKSLPSLIRRIEQIHPKTPLQFLLLDNGSKDETSQLLASIDSPLIKTSQVPVNQGYGYGICAGLKQLQSPWIGWTHADLQTDPLDALKMLDHLQKNPQENQFLKGLRFGRPLFDRLFTTGMSYLELCLFSTYLRDINAQPTIFPRSFFNSWQEPPHDFSLDLFAFALAKKKGLREIRIPVFFGARQFGHSHWNTSFAAKAKFIRRTWRYSLQLRKSFCEPTPR